jgi:hypothetical protein
MNEFILVIAPHAAKLHWVKPGVAKLYFPQWFRVDSIEDFISLREILVLKLLRDFDATNLEKLWEALLKNVAIHAPGDFYHEMVPAKLPKRPARLTRHATYVLNEGSKTYVGPLQGRLIAIALWSVFESKPFTDKDAMRVLDAPVFLRNWKGKQIPFKVFNWYRPWFIKSGIMRVIPSTEIPVRLNDVSSNELRRLKSEKKKK